MTRGGSSKFADLGVSERNGGFESFACGALPGDVAGDCGESEGVTTCIIRVVIGRRSRRSIPFIDCLRCEFLHLGIFLSENSKVVDESDVTSDDTLGEEEIVFVVVAAVAIAAQ